MKPQFCANIVFLFLALAVVPSSYAECPWSCEGDLDGDCDVDLSDLALLLSNYGRQCDPFLKPTSWTTYDPGAEFMDAQGYDPDGYADAVFDGRYVYFVPLHNGSGYSGEVLRYDTQGVFDDVGAWSAFDPGDNEVGSSPKGYIGGVFDGRYVYFAPWYNGSEHHGEVLRYDTEGAFDVPASWDTFDASANDVGDSPVGFADAAFDGQYVYFVPHAGGEVLRYNTLDAFADADAWEACNPDSLEVGNDPRGFAGAVVVGQYVYFVPSSHDHTPHGEVLRFNVAGGFCDVASWSAYDPGENGVGTDPDGYYGAAYDGERYIYFAPNENQPGQPHGEVLRLDTWGAFDAFASWATFDPGAAFLDARGYDPDGYHGVSFDNRFMYFVQYNDGSEYSGEMLRFDTDGDFDDPDSWKAFDAGNNGVGVHPDGYEGAAFDGRYIYFAPQTTNPSQAHGEALRFDTMAVH